MQSLRAIEQEVLTWMQPAMMKQEYELHAGENLVATLRWKSAWGSLATAELAEGCYTFKRIGVFNTRVTVRTEGSDENLMVFQPNWTGGGSLSLADGRTIQFKGTNFWGTDWAWMTQTDVPLVRFQSKGEVLRTEANVVIEPTARGTAELPLLVALGWYLRVTIASDSATTTAVIAAT